MATEPRKRMYADGVNSSIMKKIAIFDFGKDNFLGLKNDAKRYEFVIIVSEEVDQKKIDNFLEFWGKGGGLRIVRGVE